MVSNNAHQSPRARSFPVPNRSMREVAAVAAEVGEVGSEAVRSQGRNLELWVEGSGGRRPSWILVVSSFCQGRPFGRGGVDRESKGEKHKIVTVNS